MWGMPVNDGTARPETVSMPFSSQTLTKTSAAQRTLALGLTVLSLTALAAPAHAASLPLKGARPGFAVPAKTAPSPVSTAPVAATPGTAPVTGAPTDSASRSVRLTHAQAKAKLATAGISVYSSGGCSNRSGSSCTSLDTILTAVIDDVITLKKRSGCTVLVTGGTETGHASGPYSHWNGYKADVNMNSCLNSWVRNNGTYTGSSRWQLAKANYFYEGNHWDITAKP